MTVLVSSLIGGKGNYTLDVTAGAPDTAAGITKDEFVKIFLDDNDKCTMCVASGVTLCERVVHCVPILPLDAVVVR